MHTIGAMQDVTTTTEPDPRREAEKELAFLLSAKSRDLSGTQRREQKDVRLLQLRRWWASGFELPAIKRLAMKKFDISPAAINSLLTALVDLIDTEAEAWESTPQHLVRHRHRLRLEDLYRRASDAGSLAVAERCLRALADLDGAFRQREDDAGKPIVSIHVQGARTMSDEELAEGLRSGAERIIDVPMHKQIEE